MTLSLEDVTCSLYISIYTHIQSCTYILFVGLYILSLSFCYYYCITKTIYIYIRIHIQYPFASHSRQISPPGGTQLLLPSFVEAISKDRQKNVFVGQFVVRKLKHPQMGAKWVHQNRAGWWQLKYFFGIFIPIWGRWTHFDSYCFRMGWFNHQQTSRFVFFRKKTLELS